MCIVASLPGPALNRTLRSGTRSGCSSAQCRKRENIVWTRGTTEAINMVAQCYARPLLQPGDEIIVSEAEHHANLVPWLMVAEQTGARVVKLPLGTDYLPDVARLPELITPRSRILALGQMSNVTGGCPDLAQAIRIAHANGIIVMVDGAQGVVHFPADVQNWISIFMPSQGISSTDQPVSGRCTVSLSCWHK